MGGNKIAEQLSRLSDGELHKIVQKWHQDKQSRQSLEALLEENKCAMLELTAPNGTSLPIDVHSALVGLNLYHSKHGRLGVVADGILRTRKVFKALCENGIDPYQCDAELDGRKV